MATRAPLPAVALLGLLLAVAAAACLMGAAAAVASPAGDGVPAGQAPPAKLKGPRPARPHEQRRNKTLSHTPPRRRAQPAKPRAGFFNVNGYDCPSDPADVVQLTDADVGPTNIPGDLYALILVPGKTYVLAPGVYTITGAISFTFDTSGPNTNPVLCIIGNSTMPKDVRINGDANTVDSCNGGGQSTMFTGTAGDLEPAYGVKNLFVVGPGGFPCGRYYATGWNFMAVYGGSIYAEGIIATGLWGGDTDAYGPVFYASGSFGFYKDCIFDSNTAEEHGGAIDFVNTGGGGVVENCLFVNNTAGDGGAINVHGTCSLKLINCQYKNNRASSTATQSGSGNGGAMRVQSTGIITIVGPFCGQDNSAEATGGFAYVESGADLLFFEPSIQTVANNVPNDVYAEQNGAVYSLGVVGAWQPTPSSFTMLASIQQCGAFFSTNTIVDPVCTGGCTAWNSATCSCAAPPLRDVAIGLTITPPVAGVGSQLTFDVALTNDGGLASLPTNGFTLQVPNCVSVPNNLTPIGTPPATCSRSLGPGTTTTLVCTIDGATLAPNETWAYSLPLDASAACSVNGTATLTQPDDDPNNDVATAGATILATCNSLHTATPPQQCSAGSAYNAANANATLLNGASDFNTFCCARQFCFGGKCCNPDGSFKPSTALCRAPGACNGPAYCNGSLPDCPTTSNFPDGTSCLWSQPGPQGWYDQEQHSSRSGSRGWRGLRVPDELMWPTVQSGQAVAQQQPPRAYIASGNEAGTAAVRPCQGSCMTGRCLLVYPFDLPRGGCCHVLSQDEASGGYGSGGYGRDGDGGDQPSYYRQGRYAQADTQAAAGAAAARSAGSGYDDAFKPQHVSTTICWKREIEEEHPGDHDGPPEHYAGASRR